MSQNINLKKEITDKYSLQVRLLREFNKSIHANTFNVNLAALKDNMNIVPFDNNKWDKNPHKFCLDHYNLAEYYKLILLVNNCKTLFDFTPTKLNREIMAPKMGIIETILTYSY